jgi:UDP-N-acetyl-D-glucosamine dehydrogenase
MAMESVPDLPGALAAADCVVIATDHDTYDWAGVRQAARLLVDTRMWQASGNVGRIAEIVTPH